MSLRKARVPALAILAILVIAACNTRGETPGASLTTQETFNLATLPVDPPPMCIHLSFPWSDWDCPRMTAQRAWLPPQDIDTLWLIVKMKSGEIYTARVDTAADVIFLGKRAVDSIFVRYYNTIRQTAKADSLRTAANSFP